MSGELREVDVVLFGSGVAPLVAAKALLSRGKTVLILNPDWDFFLENSELPLDPLLTLQSAQNFNPLSPHRISLSTAKLALQELGPEFPGAVESVTLDGSNQRALTNVGFQDRGAPFIRSRTRIWVKPRRNPSAPSLKNYWEQLETLYVTASDQRMDPRIEEGISAVKRFPGLNLLAADRDEEFQSLCIPKLVDVDIDRYRYGLLEFIRDKISSDAIVNEAAQVDFSNHEVRYYRGKVQTSVKILEGVVFFWTPKLTQYIRTFMKKQKLQPQGGPKAVRMWEEWILVSRDALDPSTVGVFEDMVLWADIEGAPKPDQNLQRLVVLREGPLLPVPELASWASADSFQALSVLCHDFLKWKNFSVLAMHPRATLEWDGEKMFEVSSDYPKILFAAADGPLMSVVQTARESAKRIIQE